MWWVAVLGTLSFAAKEDPLVVHVDTPTSGAAAESMGAEPSEQGATVDENGERKAAAIETTTTLPTTKPPTTPSPEMTLERIAERWLERNPTTSPPQGPAKRLFAPAAQATKSAKDVISQMGHNVAQWKMDWRTQFIKAEDVHLDVAPLQRTYSDIGRSATAQSVMAERNGFFPALQPLVDRMVALDNPGAAAPPVDDKNPCPVGRHTRCWPGGPLIQVPRLRGTR
jgi:hypothetical protein